jgi:hypothetical protein
VISFFGSRVFWQIANIAEHTDVLGLVSLYCGLIHSIGRTLSTWPLSDAVDPIHRSVGASLTILLPDPETSCNFSFGGVLLAQISLAGLFRIYA